MKRRGWVERKEPYRLMSGAVPSYELRLSESWMTVHVLSRPLIILSPMGINVGRKDGYDSLDEAMEAAEDLYRERLFNGLDSATRTLRETDKALAFFGIPQPSSRDEERTAREAAQVEVHKLKDKAENAHDALVESRQEIEGLRAAIDELLEAVRLVQDRKELSYLYETAKCIEALPQPSPRPRQGGER